MEVVNGAIAQPKPQAPVLPFWKRVPVPPALRRLAEPRLMMTAAMAFFSIALTLNLAGVRLTAVRISDLKPSVLRTNLTRQIINSKAGVVRYYDNLRFVYDGSQDARVAPRHRVRRAGRKEAPAAFGAAARPPRLSRRAALTRTAASQRVPEMQSPGNDSVAQWKHVYDLPRDRATGTLGRSLNQPEKPPAQPPARGSLLKLTKQKGAWHELP